MQMDMLEPGEMCCCGGERHDLAMDQRAQAKITGLRADKNHIIVSKFPA